jgi:hypothetical protein
MADAMITKQINKSVRQTMCPQTAIKIYKQIIIISIMASTQMRVAPHISLISLAAYQVPHTSKCLTLLKRPSRELIVVDLLLLVDATVNASAGSLINIFNSK